MTKAIEARIDFQGLNSDELLLEIIGLPDFLRPTHFNIGEDEPRRPLIGSKVIPSELQGQTLGYFLYGPDFIYDTTISPGGAIAMHCQLGLSFQQVEELLTRLAVIRPLHGYAAKPEERLARNQIRHQLGMMKIEAWVGRDPSQWLPGLYWLNLISEELAERHGISLDLLAAASWQHRDLGNGQHLFRLYDQPEDWKASDRYRRFLEEIPGLFDIEVVKKQLSGAKNFLELQSELRKWQSGSKGGLKS